jgi:protein CpxP
MKVTMAGRLVLVVAGLLMAGTAAGAQGFGGGQGVGPGFGNRRPPMERAFGAAGGNKGWWNNPRIAERLKLTDDQRKAMDGILLQHREKLIDLQANLQKAELTMQPLMGADTPNSAAITAQIDKVVQARGDLERANARFLLAIREKLTPDQWKQLQAARENGGMHGEQHERWGHDGQRPGMQGPGGQFHRQPPPPPPDSPQQAPAPGSTAPGAGTGPGEMQ